MNVSCASMRGRRWAASSASTSSGKVSRRRTSAASIMRIIEPRRLPRHAITQAERGSRSMDLYSSGHRRGVVCAPHAGAVEDGRTILAEGGNAIEAMLAMAATIAAVYPHMNHIGGDGFWLIREPNGRVRALMGAGRAGSKATIRFYRDAGYDEIPPRGSHAALTVPGAVAAWALAQEEARAQGGRLPLDLLLAPAIKHAREGYTVTRSQARLTREKLPEMDK